MTKVSKTDLKGYFNTGDTPTESNFEDVFDTLVAVSTAAGTGALVVDVSGVATAHATGTVGLQILSTEATASATNILGFGTVGAIVVGADTTASAVDNLGLTTVTKTDAAATVASKWVFTGDVDFEGAVTGAGADETDVRLAFLLIAENAGDRVNMVDGIADPFKDETDVDTATSTNEVYDATGDFYNGETEVQIDQNDGTEFTTMDTNTAAWHDGTTSQTNANSTKDGSSSTSGFNNWVGRIFSSPKIIRKVVAYSPSRS